MGMKGGVSFVFVFFGDRETTSERQQGYEIYSMNDDRCEVEAVE